MAKPNYAYAKRQRDIAKKQKKEEKKQLKKEAQQPTQEDTASQTLPPSADEPAVD